MSNCGVCNKEVPIGHTQLGIIESDGTLTSYHMGCEGASVKINPCEDCGHHRLLCNDCAEPEWDGEPND